MSGVPPQYFVSPMQPGVRPQDDPDYDGLTFVYVFTTVLAPWTQPPVNQNVVLVVANSQGFVAGMVVVIGDGYQGTAGYYQVVNATVYDRLTVMNYGTNYNQPAGTGFRSDKITTTSLPGPPGGIGPIGPPGLHGDPGPPLNPKGTVPTAADLPLTGNNAGDLIIADDTGIAWAWNGTQWVDMGQFSGTGAPGTRGSLWFSGAGAPPDPIPGSLPGDQYLDAVSGNVYQVT